MPVTRRLAPLLLAAACSCASYGPPPPVAGVSFETGTDFSIYRTFDFLPVPPALATVAASLDYFGIDGILARDLNEVGLLRSLGGSPDLLVAYYQGGRQVDIGAWGYRAGPGTPVAVQDVPASCLVVDVIDAGSRVLVWRGIATDALLSRSSIEPAIRQMLQQWPGRRAP